MTGKGRTGAVQGIRYVSMHENSGYGIAAYRYLEGFANLGIPFTWTPMVRGRKWGMGYEPFQGAGVGDARFDAYCNRVIDYDTVVVHTVPEYFPFWAAKEPGKRIVGYTVWETDRIPGHWPYLLNGVAHLLVPCGWNLDVFRRCGVTVPLSVVPHIVRDAGDQGPRDIPGIPPSDFVFYTIGTWTERKAIWKTLQSYWDGFTSTDAVVLVIKTSKKDFTRGFFGRPYGASRGAIKRLKRRYDNPAPIFLMTDEVNDPVIECLHRRGDCFVSLCRSEGWGLGAFDAAGAGNPVIMTGFGGQREYLNADTAFLVKYTLIPTRVKLGRRSYSPDQRWAEPDVGHASRLMRMVYENHQAVRKKANRLKGYVHEHFNETVVMKRFMRVILEK